MKFTLNAKDIFSHILLNQGGVEKEVSKTPQWKEGKNLDVTMQMNGVEVDPYILTKIMHQWRDDWVESIRKEYDADNFDKRVEEAAKKIVDEKHQGLVNNLQTQCDEVSEVLVGLSKKLSVADLLIKYEWEK